MVISNLHVEFIIMLLTVSFQILEVFKERYVTILFLELLGRPGLTVSLSIVLTYQDQYIGI